MRYGPNEWTSILLDWSLGTTSHLQFLIMISWTSFSLSQGELDLVSLTLTPPKARNTAASVASPQWKRNNNIFGLQELCILIACTWLQIEFLPFDEVLALHSAYNASLIHALLFHFFWFGVRSIGTYVTSCLRLTSKN